MKEHHWSPLDMIDFTFEVETSRAIGRQWLRHSSIRPQEHSQRYSDRVYFEDIELRLEDKVNRQSSTETVGAVWFSDLEITGVTHEWTEFALEGLNLLNSIEAYYKKGIKLGVAKECMRSWLPECTTSTLTFKGSLRSWLSFLNVRCDHHSQKEIVELANLVGEALEKEMPNVFAQIDWRKGMFM
jgi:thymidylate synthase (FAD)